MKNEMLTIAICAMLLNSCNQTENNNTNNDKNTSTTNSTNSATATADNSFNALDWQGTYIGTLSCDDCDGKQISIVLDKNLSYTAVVKHITKSAKLPLQKGTFEWNNEGNKITLNNVQNIPSRYLVGENELLVLDADGNRLQGNYSLTKQDSGMAPISNFPITETRWILQELTEQKNKLNAAKNKPFFIQLRASDNRVIAFGGCNNIAGNYAITENNQVKFTELMSTMMACENMETETILSKVLEQTNSYKISGNTMQLLNKQMQPLATFVAE